MAIQSEFGKIGVFEDFNGIAATFSIADATAGTRYNDLCLVATSGQSEVDYTVTASNGLITFNGAGGAADGIAVLSAPMQPSANGTIAMGARFKNSSASDGRIFVGWQSTASLSETVNPFTLSATTLTANNAGSVVGFYWDTTATTKDYRFMASLGGVAATSATCRIPGSTTTTLGSLGVRANATPAADSFVVARVEIDPDGTARGYIGAAGMGNQSGLTLVCTLKAGAFDRTAFMFPVLGCYAASTGDPTQTVDYFWAKGSRNWTS